MTPRSIALASLVVLMTGCQYLPNLAALGLGPRAPQAEMAPATASATVELPATPSVVPSASPSVAPASTSVPAISGELNDL